MKTMDDYFKAEPHERAFIDSLKPPIVHKHRMPGPPDVKAARERAKQRTTPPKHRGEPRPTLEELRYVNAHIGRNHV